MSDQDIKREYDEAYDQAISDWSGYLTEAYTDLSFMLGNQWSDADKSYLASQRRSAYVSNVCKSLINQISGYQRRNRMSSICEPIEGGDQLISDISNDILLFHLQSQGGYNLLSDAFESGPLVTGLSLISLWMDYSQDVLNGELRLGKVPYNSFLLDPMFTRLDLADCRYLLRRKYVSHDEAKLLLPGQSKEIERIKIPYGSSDSKFSYMQYANNTDKGLLRYDEFWKRTSKKGTLLIDSMTGESLKWKGTPEALRVFLQQYPWVEKKTIYEPSVELSIILEDEVVYNGPDQYGLGDYPFVPLVGYYYPEYDNFAYKLQGVIRNMRDMQDELNKTKSRISDIIASQINSGWLVKEGAVKNPTDLYKTGQGIVIEYDRNYMSTDVQRIPAPEASQSLFALSSSLPTEIIKLGGGSEELLGIAEGGNTQISGVLAQQRAYNSVTTLQGLFDNFSLSQRILSKKILKMVYANWDAAKISTITDKQVPQDISSIDITKYDISIKETMLTESQRNLYFLQLLEAKRAGMYVSEEELINASPIVNKTEYIKSYQAAQQQQQQQQQQITEQEEIAKRLANAETIHKLSLAEQQRKRAVADQALAMERLSQVGQNKASATLDMAKAASEVQGMKQSQLIEAINFLRSLAAEKSENLNIVSGLSEQRDSTVASNYAAIGNPQPGVINATEEGL